HERAFAGVGVADQGDGVLFQPGADLAFLAGLDFAQPAAQVADAVVYEPAVLFELRFTGAAEADAAFVARQVGPHFSQPGQRVLELRQLALQTVFRRASARPT